MEYRCIICSETLDISHIASEGEWVQINCPGCGLFHYERSVESVMQGLKKTEDYGKNEMLMMQNWLKRTPVQKVTLCEIANMLPEQISRCQKKLQVKWYLPKTPENV